MLGSRKLAGGELRWCRGHGPPNSKWSSPRGRGKQEEHLCRFNRRMDYPKACHGRWTAGGDLGRFRASLCHSATKRAEASQGRRGGGNTVRGGSGGCLYSPRERRARDTGWTPWRRVAGAPVVTEGGGVDRSDALELQKLARGLTARAARRLALGGGGAALTRGGRRLTPATHLREGIRASPARARGAGGGAALLVRSGLSCNAGTARGGRGSSAGCGSCRW